MALDKHGVPDKKMEPDLFDEKCASQLKWAELVADRKILKSKERSELKQHLVDLLDGLDLRYIKGKPSAFPTNGELVKLMEVIYALAKLLGVKKSGFGDLFGAVKRIENKFSKIPLLDFVDQLRDRLCQIPTSPASVVYQTSEKNQADKAILEAIKVFLTGKPTDDAKTPWLAWYQAVKKLKLSRSVLKLADIEKLAQSGGLEQQTQLACLWMMDLRRQQLEWNLQYGKFIEASLKWIYLLQRPEDFEKLTRVFYGEATSPIKMEVVLNKSGNARRQRKFHKKKVK